MYSVGDVGVKPCLIFGKAVLYIIWQYNTVNNTLMVTDVEAKHKKIIMIYFLKIIQYVFELLKRDCCVSISLKM